MRSIITLLAGSVALAGCAFSCTEMGCMGSFQLTFEAETWDEGLYTLSVDFGENGTQACSFTIPLEAGIVCDETEISLSDSGLVVPLRTGMSEDYADVAVTLEYEDAILVDQTIDPEWSEPFHPNGQACDRGSGCISAAWTFTL